MTTQFLGEAALVANNLPSAKTVTGATNATPIVVTTSAAHGLNVGEVFVISGVTGNTAANGTFIAGAVTSTTVTLTAFPGGTNVAGTGGYVSGGSLQSLAFGQTVPIPNDLTDATQAATVCVPFEAILDRLAWLSYVVRGGGAIASTVTRVAHGTILVSDGTTAIPNESFSFGAVNVPAGGETMQVVDCLPNGATLTALSANMQPANHGSIVGLTLPVVGIYKVNATTGARTLIGQQLDTSGSAAAYSAPHDVTIAGMSEVIDNSTYLYVMLVQWENGGAFSAAGSHMGARVTFTVPGAIPIC